MSQVEPECLSGPCLVCRVCIGGLDVFGLDNRTSTRTIAPPGGSGQVTRVVAVFGIPECSQIFVVTPFFNDNDNAVTALPPATAASRPAHEGDCSYKINKVGCQYPSRNTIEIGRTIPISWESGKYKNSTQHSKQYKQHNKTATIK